MERDNAATTIEGIYNHEQRLRDDTETWLAEVLDGQMRTEFEYVFNGHELYGEDGSALGSIFKTAIKDAERLAAFNPGLRFEVRRRHIENEELQDMYAMRRGELPNTMVVVSDFPPEIKNVAEDIGGYNVKRQQTMLRVISMDLDGKIRMRSQSLDRSDRQALEAIYRALGVEPKPGELLGQRIHLDLPAQEQEFLASKLTGVYDRTLSLRYGGEWYAGRTPPEMLNTYDFVRTQHDLIDTFVQVKLYDSQQAESIRYNLAALMEQRFNSRLKKDSGTLVRHPIFGYEVLREMENAGQQARANGKSYSGCGMTLGSLESQGTDGQLEESGYGNKSDKEETNKLPSMIRCINCKEKVPSKEVVKPKSWCCPNCKYEVDVCTGKVICPGKKG